MESNKMGMKCIADLHKHTCTYKKTVPHSIHAVILTDRPPIVDTDLQFYKPSTNSGCRFAVLQMNSPLYKQPRWVPLTPPSSFASTSMKVKQFDHTHTPINLSVKIKEHVMSNGFLELVDRMELKPKDAMEILKFSHCT
jgi:hypothetical protein